MEIQLVRKKKKKNNKYKIIIIVLVALLVLGASTVTVIYVKNKTKLIPDYAPGTIDINAIKEKDSDIKKMEKTSGGAVSVRYSDVVKVEKDKMTLYFKNPSKSLAGVVLQVIIVKDGKEYVIGETDLIPSGYAIYNLALKSGVDLVKGGYDGKFRMYYYDEETSEKSIINTSINVSIEVL